MECTEVGRFWAAFFNWWNETGHSYPQFQFPHWPGAKEILLGIPGRDNKILVLNFCILYGKFYIYKQRLFGENNLSLRSFLASLKYQLQIEELVSKNQSKP